MFITNGLRFESVIHENTVFSQKRVNHISQRIIKGPKPISKRKEKITDRHLL